MNFYLYCSTAFVIGIIIAKPIIAALVKLKSTQSFREQGPQSHIQTKSGTPTMGAWIFLIPIFVVTLMIYFNDPNTRTVLIMLAFLVGTVLGAIDDILKVLGANYKGLDSKFKLLVQLITSFAIAFFSERYLFTGIETEIPSPILIGFEFIWAFIVIAGSSNAINLTDGLDGLAASLSILAFLGLGIIFYSQGDFSLAFICIGIIGALMAFLFFNWYPAKVFMGDTGSLALGMGLGAIAYLARLEWHLLIFALVPVIETLSVVLQVASAKLSRRFLGKDLRLFRMAPLHHHFELVGMHEIVILLMFLSFQVIVSAIFLGTKLI